MWSAPRSYLEDNWGNEVSSVQEFMKRGLERVKLRTSTVRSRCQGTAGEDSRLENS
jgi:hypothetical protein